MLALALAAHLALGQYGTAAEPAFPSIWTARPLEGGSVAVAWAGFANLGAAYAQGVTDADDLGGQVDLDWATTELRLGGFYRRPLGRLGGWDLGARMGVAWYVNFGSTWAREANAPDRGVELAPAVVVSRPLSGGVLHVGADLPLTLTFWREGGFVFRPRLALGYEVSLWSDVALGARISGGWRTGGGDAPLTATRGELGFLLTATYRVL